MTLTPAGEFPAGRGLSHNYGFTLLKANFPVDPSEYAAAVKQFSPMLPAETLPYARGLAEEVFTGRHSGNNEFTFGLDILLGGLDELRDKPPVRKRNGKWRRA